MGYCLNISSGKYIIKTSIHHDIVEMENLASLKIFQLKVVVFVLDGYIDGFSLLYLGLKFDSSSSKIVCDGEQDSSVSSKFVSRWT